MIGLFNKFGKELYKLGSDTSQSNKIRFGSGALLFVIYIFSAVCHMVDSPNPDRPEPTRFMKPCYNWGHFLVVMEVP